MINPPGEAFEYDIIALVQWLKLGIEAFGVPLVAIPICVSGSNTDPDAGNTKTY